MPDAYKENGAFIKMLPYYNPDSCVLLIRQNVPTQWQGTAYENLFLNGPEDSPLELGFKHLDTYEQHFPSDTATEFALLWRGRLYTHLGKLDSAHACLQASYESALRHKRYLQAGDAQKKIGQIYHKEAKTAQALRSYLAVYDALKNLDTAQNLRKFSCMVDISNAYVQFGNLREALIWLDSAAALVNDENNPAYRDGKIGTIARYSYIYIKLNQLDSAIFTAQKALALQEKYQTNIDRSELLVNLGNAYLAKKDCKKALQPLLEAQRTKRRNDPSSTYYLSSKLAEAYACIGQLDTAEMLYKQALQSPATVTLANAQQGLSEVYAQKGNYQAAFEVVQAFLKTRNQVLSPEKMQEIANVKSELELERLNLKTAELKHAKESAQQHTLLIFLSLLLLLMVGSSLFMRQRSRVRILEQEKLLLEQDKSIAEAFAQLHAQALEHSKASLQIAHEELKETTHALALKNQLIEQLQMGAEAASTKVNAANNQSDPLAKAQLLRMKILTNDDWWRFREQFEAIFPNFLTNLKNHFPELTTSDVRLFMLLKLQFDVTQMAEILGISAGSVWQARQRLTKKLGLASTVAMEGFVRSFGEPNSSGQ